MLLPVPEVVFQVIALGLKHVVVFVLDLPARAPGTHQAGRVVRRDRPVGDPGVAINRLVGVVRHRHVAPVDRQRLVAVGQRRAGDEIIETEGLHAPFDAGTGSKVQVTIV